MIGQQAGNFTILQKLGEGGMGVVYLAQHNETRRKAAIKVLLPQWTQNELIAQRFKNEAIAMGTLNHPNIVDVLDSGTLPNGSYYLAMEFLEGGTLGRFCASQGGPVSPHVALQILAQIAAGLEAAHKRGIVHRDLKPENVFLTTRGKNQHFVKLLDWGISKLGEIGAGAATGAGMVAGTPTYMAPEQMFDLRSVDRRSDVYALGVIAYQMITGGWLPFQQPGQGDPFGELSLPAIHHALMHSDPIPPRQRIPGLDARWENAILAALHRDPARRPQTAKAFVLMLAAATPGDGYQPAGADILDRYAGELLDVSNLDETVRAVKPASARAASRYRLGDQLGAGGMAEVFRATQVGAEGVARTVAVKRVLPGFSTMPQFASMFVDEARLASLLAHQNIVSVLDFDRDENGQLFLVMEFVAGRDLAAIAASGRLPFSVSIFVISEALRGLGYAHNLPTTEGPRGVIHRDVSPQNVLVSWEGAVKVSDFGIAKARAATVATASTMIKGKPQYMSPEQANGMPLDGRSDLFAVGIMLWELLTGRRLFEGTTQEVLTRLMTARIPPPSSVSPDVPPDLDAVTMRMLAQDPDARYLTAELAIEDLARCAAAPRNGQGELSRVLAERFPAEIAARSSRSSGPPVASTERSTANARGLATTRQDPAPQPTPVAQWPRDTTLGSAASQSAPPVGAPRRGRWLGAVLGVSVVAGVAGAAVFLATRKTETEPAAQNETVAPQKEAATTPAPAKVATPEPMLTVNTEPAGATVRIDGTERGRTPLTVAVARGTSLTVEVARDGYEASKQVVVVERDAQSLMLALKPVAAVAVTPASASAPSTAVVPEARPTKQASSKAAAGKAPASTKKPTSTAKPKAGDTTFNPDDAIGD